MKKLTLRILAIISLTVVLIFVSKGTEWFEFGKNKIVKSDYIKFSHSKHIELGTDCSTCHAIIEKSISNSIKTMPTHTECSSCHESEITSNCGFCHNNSKDVKPIPYVKSEIIFNHKVHIGKFNCTDCHENLDKVELASEINFPKMEKCFTCHDGKIASSDCEKCHTNISELRPLTHTLSNFKREHGKIVNSRTQNLCESCHVENECSVCHDANNLTSISTIEKTGLLSPRSSSNTNSKIFNGELVHDINYRFTHGIDSQVKSQKCQTCHQKETFCNDCHKNGSLAISGAMPTSHEQNNFITIGVGTGGGLHAQLAKRDIESCSSCHDALGEDPTCINCHNDPDGILFTNPKTHKSKLYLNINGNWHTDENANCYSCHYDANATPKGIKGIGFCGYCHGR